MTNSGSRRTMTRTQWRILWSLAVSHFAHMAADALCDTMIKTDGRFDSEALEAATKYARRFRRSQARLYTALGREMSGMVIVSSDEIDYFGEKDPA